MGVAIVAITICHINQFIGEYKDIQSVITNEFFYASAAVGVDVFFFFSLVGLGFSLEKNKLIGFYKRRIKRIFPAYLLFLLIVLFVFYRDICFNDKWILFSQQISGFSATKYVSQRIEWYVPSLLILYALYPLLFLMVRWVHNCKHNNIFELLFLGAIVFTSYIVGVLFVGLFAMRLPLYYLAILSYFYIKDGRVGQLDVIYILAACCSFVVKNELLSYALIIPLFLLVVNHVIDGAKWGKLFAWLGKYTLEIYLAQVVATKYLIKVLPTNNVLFIVLSVLFVTAVISLILHKFQSFVYEAKGYLDEEIHQSHKDNRIGWVDAAKGIAMLIIMWGHVQHTSPVKEWLTSFHVPIFLVLTGILIARKEAIGGGG